MNLGYIVAELMEEVIPKFYHQKKKALRVSPVEPLTGPWTGNNSIGQMTDFAPDANNQQVILKLPEWGMPHVWTVTLNVEYPDPYPIATPLPAPQYDFDIVGRISVGVGGASYDFEVDWKRGTTFSVPSNALNVQCRYSLANIPDIGVVIPANVRIGAFASRGTVHKDWNATYTVRNMVAASFSPTGGKNVYWTNIPRFARKVLLQPTSGNDFLAPTGLEPLFAPDTTVQLRSSNYIRSYLNGDSLLYHQGQMVIPNGANILMVSGIGLTIDAISAVFDLGG